MHDNFVFAMTSAKRKLAIFLVATGLAIPIGVSAGNTVCPPNVPASVDRRCDAQYRDDNARCNKLPKPAMRARCFHSATSRLGACCLGRPLPPLILW